MSGPRPWGLATVFLLALIWAGGGNGAARAEDYHVDALKGDDGRSGRSPEKAWQSLKRVNRHKFSPGDRILFQRGQTFRGRLAPPSSGTAEKPITFGAHGQGERPRLRGSAAFNQARDWTQAGEGLWYLRLIEHPPGVFLADGKPGRARPRKEELSAQWDFWHDSLRKRLYVKSSVRPTDLASLIEVAREEFTVGPQRADHIVFQGLDLGHARSSTWLGWGCKDVTFRDCAFHGSGENHLQFNNGSGQGRVEGCLFDDWNMVDTLGYAVQVITKGSGPVDIDNCVFRATRQGGGQDHTAIMNDNEGWVRTVRGCRFQGGQGRLADDGVVIWRPAARADQVVIENNRFMDLGGIAVTIMDLEFHGAKPRVLVQGNYIQRAGMGDDLDKEALRLRMFTPKSRVQVSYNIINRTAQGKNLHHGIHCRDASGPLIWNNVVSGADSGLVLTKSSRMVEARNNIFSVNRGFGIRVESGSSLAKEGHNCIFANAEGPYQGLRGSATDILADPKLGQGFVPAKDSPCRGAGVRLDLTRDFQGRDLEKGRKPDIGALQSP